MNARFVANLLAGLFIALYSIEDLVTLIVAKQHPGASPAEAVLDAIILGVGIMAMLNAFLHCSCERPPKAGGEQFGGDPWAAVSWPPKSNTGFPRRTP